MRRRSPARAPPRSARRRVGALGRVGLVGLVMADSFADTLSWSALVFASIFLEAATAAPCGGELPLNDVAGGNRLQRVVDEPVGEGIPDTTATWSPISRPRTTGLRATHAVGTTATCVPCWPKISAVTGMRSALGSAGKWNSTSEKAPGHSFPSLLSACNSDCAMRELSATAFEVERAALDAPEPRAAAASPLAPA